MPEGGNGSNPFISLKNFEAKMHIVIAFSSSPEGRMSGKNLNSVHHKRYG